MSYFRSYFEKNNTIIKNSKINTSKNPITEIYYGDGFSKFIFKIDFTNLKNKLTNKELVLDNNTKHYLNLTNTIFGDETLASQIKGNSKRRATSFDLILFKINEFWDEGVGYDYTNNNYLNSTVETTFYNASNWYNRTTLNNWSVDGISTNPTVLTTIHFDNGYENINVDITNYVNDVLNNNIVDYGLCLAFPQNYDFNDVEAKSVSFFTKYTQTFYEPFVESVFQDRILDNRYNFNNKTNQNLYLFINDYSNNINLDNNPVIDVKNALQQTISGLTNITTTLVKKGVYKANFSLNGIVCDNKRFFYDVWKNLNYQNTQLTDVTQKFIPNNFDNNFKIGENNDNYSKFNLKFNGISKNEQILSGDVRKLMVNFRNIENKSFTSNEVYFKLFVKEGKTQVIVHDWTLFDMTNEIFYYLDTSYLIPKEYFLEIKYKINNEIIINKDIINFEIVNRK